MKTKKMSLANIQGKLSRIEMKKIMAGSGGGSNCPTNCTSACNESNNCRCCGYFSGYSFCDDASNGC